MSYYNTGTLTLAASNTVVGSGTTFLANVKAGDTLMYHGVSEVVRSVEDNTHLTLESAWTGDTGTGLTGWKINHTGGGWHTIVTVNEKVVDLIDIMEGVHPLKPDATGTLAQRAAYDTQAQGFVFAQTDVGAGNPISFFVKASGTTGDWAGPLALKGIKGDAGPAGGTYGTVTEAIAAHIPTGTNAVAIGGYSAIGDGGAALYKRVSSEPAHAGKFQDANAAWWELAEFVITPEMFGAKADLLTNLSNVSTATDNTAAFGRVAAFTNAKGGAVINFRPGSGYYKVWPNGGAMTGQELFYFNAAAVIINFNGAKFYTDNAFPGAGNNQVFFFESCPVVDIREPYYQQSGRTLTPNGFAPTFFWANNDCPSVTITNFRMLGGSSVLQCRPTTQDTNTPLSPRPGRVRLTGYMEDVYYGFNGCSDYLYMSVKAVNEGRAYFPITPIGQHEVWLDSAHGGQFNTCMIEVRPNNLLQATENGIGSITINLTSKGRSASALDGAVGNVVVIFSPIVHDALDPEASACPGYLGKLEVNYFMLQGATGHGSMMLIEKYLGSSPDTTVRGHTIGEIAIGGTFGGIAPTVANPSTTLIDCMAGSVPAQPTGSFAGEAVGIFAIRNVHAPSTTKAINIDMNKWPGRLVLENIIAPDATIAITGEDRSRIVERGVKMQNRTSDTGYVDYSATIAAVGGALGAGATATVRMRVLNGVADGSIRVETPNGIAITGGLEVLLPATPKKPTSFSVSDIGNDGSSYHARVNPPVSGAYAIIAKENGSFAGMNSGVYVGDFKFEVA